MLNGSAFRLFREPEFCAFQSPKSLTLELSHPFSAVLWMYHLQAKGRN